MKKKEKKRWITGKNCRVFTKRVSSLRLTERGKTHLWLSQRVATADLSGQEGKQCCGGKELSLEERLENVRNNPTTESIEALKIIKDSI